MINMQRHPRPVYLLSFIIACELFSFYCMKNILLYYFIEGPMQMTESIALTTSGAFASLFSIVQFCGGIISDKLIGTRLSIYFGLICMVIAHLLLSIPYEGIFMFGLGFLIVGGAFVRLQSTSMFGSCYDKNDNRRLEGFTFMYMLFNLSVIFSSLFAEKIARTFGWHYGFGLAAIVLIGGFIVYYKQRHILESIGNPPVELTLVKWLIIIFFSIISAFVFKWIIVNSYLYKYILIVVSTIAASYFIYIGVKEAKMESFLKMSLAIVGFIMVSTLVFQLDSSFMLFAKRNVSKVIEFSLFSLNFQWTLTNNMLTMFNPIAIVIFGILITRLWNYLSNRNIHISDINKMTIAPIIIIFGFLALYLITYISDNQSQVPYYYAIMAVCLISFTELFAQPIGFAVITNESPEKYAGVLLGIFKLSTGIALFASSQLARVTAIDKDMSPQESLVIYREGFFKLMIISCVVSFIFILLAYGLNLYLKRNNSKKI